MNESNGAREKKKRKKKLNFTKDRERMNEREMNTIYLNSYTFSLCHAHKAQSTEYIYMHTNNC